MPASPGTPAVQLSSAAVAICVGVRNEHQQQQQQRNCQDRQPAAASGQQQEEVRKIKRLVAMFRLWGSKSELQMNEVIAPTVLEQQQQQQQQHTNNNNTNNRTPQQPIGGDMSFINIPNDLVTRNSQGGSISDSDESSEVQQQQQQPRLWQSLVVPLVLGCVIFLLAVWTRQISLLVVNDAIVMVLLLGSVFIVMSAVAFWLAQEQQHHLQPGESGLISGLSADNHIHRHLMHHNHCPHHHHHHHHLSHLQHHLNHNHSTTATDQTTNQQQSQNNRNTKCCGVAFIDLQPPDYYSALRNSLPVLTPHLASFRIEEDQPNGEEDANTVGASGAEPPSYDELAIVYGCGNGDGPLFNHHQLP